MADLASTRVFGTLVVKHRAWVDGGEVWHSKNAPYLKTNGWGGVRHTTSDGYIDLGPANADHAHIYTDRPDFYFNKDLVVNGNKVWHAGNTGEFTINGQDFRGRGKRCIVASTSAMFLNYAGDFTNVTIQSDAVISGILTANDHLRSGAMNFSTYKEWDTGEFNALGGGAAIVNDSTGHKGLMILGNRSAGGNRIVKVWDELQCMGDVKAYASDARLKTNVQTIDSALDKLSRIRGVTYDWIEDCEDLGFCPANPHEHGVIAQEIESVIPDAVSSAPFNEDYLTVRYDRIVPLLIEALKEEAALREQLQRRVQTLESGQEVA